MHNRSAVGRLERPFPRNPHPPGITLWGRLGLFHRKDYPVVGQPIEDHGGYSFYLPAQLFKGVGRRFLLRPIASVLQGNQPATGLAEGQGELQQQGQFGQSPDHHQVKGVPKVFITRQLLGTAGNVILFVCVLCFATTTILTYSFYGAQCASFLFGARYKTHYRWFYVTFIIVASVVTLEAAIGFIDGAFAMMAIPTMFAAIALAPKVKLAADDYFSRLAKS